MHITQHSWLFTDLTSSSYCSLKKEIKTLCEVYWANFPAQMYEKRPCFSSNTFPMTILPPFHIRIEAPFMANWTHQYFFLHPFHSFLLPPTISSTKQHICFQGPVIWWFIVLFFLWLQLLRSWDSFSLLSYWANCVKY